MDANIVRLCEYLDALGECGGNCFADIDGDGVCDEEIMLGCTNEMACNYDSASNLDNGICFFSGDQCDDGDLLLKTTRSQ